MKKTIAFLLCLFLCLSLLSCDTETSSQGDDSNPQQTSGGDNVASKGHKHTSSDDDLTENEIAKKAYEAVIQNKTTIYYSPNNSSEPKSVYFKDVLNYSNFGASLMHAVIDMDQDGIDEMVIKNATSSEKTFILHYENATVYGFSFNTSAMRNIYTDGSFSWSYYYGADGGEYGKSRISFVNGKIKFEELSRIEGYYKYFLNGKEVTEDKFYNSPIQTEEKTLVEFTPINPYLTQEGQALRIASAHWGIKDGDFDAETGYRYNFTVYKDGDKYYRVCMYWFVNNSYYEHLECLWVDIDSGEITAPDYPDAKG